MTGISCDGKVLERYKDMRRTYQAQTKQDVTNDEFLTVVFDTYEKQKGARK